MIKNIYSKIAPSLVAQRGIALIDIALVLIAIGLVGGTFITGSMLVKNAKVNIMMSQIYKYKATYKLFKIRYYAIPGDMPDASRVIQGVMPSQNGNGDSKINFKEDNFGETLLPWVHMEKAGFIDNTSDTQYSGTPCCGNQNWGVTSVDNKESKAPNVAKPVIPDYISNMTKDNVPVYMFFYSTGKNEGNKLALSWSDEDENRPFYAPIVPSEQQKIDKKYDDAMPLSGYIISDAGLIADTNLTVRNNPDNTCTDGNNYLQTLQSPGVEGCMLVLDLKD